MVTAVDEFRDSVGAALLWLLMLPGVLPGLAVAVLVLGLRRARRVRQPVRYSFGVITTAAALVCFSLIPAYAKNVHARRPDEEWFWQFLGLVVARLRAQWPRLTLVHRPIHASWLNQVEIYFSIVQRKVVTPNDFTSLRELEDRLLTFQRRYAQMA